MACSASCGGSRSSQLFQRIKQAPTERSSCVCNSVSFSKSNHAWFDSPRANASSIKASSFIPNSGDLRARASDKSCCGDTRTSSKATTSCTSQHSIKSVFSPIWAAMCRRRNSSCIRSKAARLRASTITSAACKHWLASGRCYGAGAQACCFAADARRIAPPHIAAQIGEKTDLIECCEVQDVVALLDVLVSKQHDLSLARVLKSPLFSLNDENLVQLALAQREAPQPWFDLLATTSVQTLDQRPV